MILLTSGSLSLDQAKDKLWDVRTGDIGFEWRGVAAEHFSHGERDFDDEPTDALEEQNYDGHMGEDPGVFQSPDLRFAEDAEVVLGGGVGSFGGRAEGLELMMPVGSAEHLNDQPGEVGDRHMTSKSVVVDPVPAVFGVLSDLRII